MDTPVRHAQLPQRSADLVDDLLAVRQDDHAVALRRGAQGDVGEDHRFAAAGGQHEQDSQVTQSECQANAIDAIELVGSQDWLEHRHESPAPGCPVWSEREWV